MEAKISHFGNRERERLGGFQENCKSMVQMFIDEGDADTKADLAPLQTWASEFTTKGDINSHRPLARLLTAPQNCGSATRFRCPPRRTRFRQP